MSLRNSIDGGAYVEYWHKVQGTKSDYSFLVHE